MKRIHRLAVLLVVLGAGVSPQAQGRPSSSAKAAQASQFAAAVSAYDRQDYATALSLLGTLANQGYGPAQNNLGMMYATGRGVQQDYAAAAALLRKAAEQGYGLGEFDLGAMYGNGLGMPQDYVQAYKWFSLAVEQAGDAATRDAAKQNRDGLTALMTPAQISQARKLAGDCLRSHFLICD